jgi:tetratricopeptide (TPR) repeat protein
VQGIIASRLDALPPDEKRLLQDAAVIGKVFWLGALDATERQLHSLEQKEFVQQARRSSVAGQMEFAFKHLLVRDVAYGQIPRGERAAKHLLAAEWIEALGRREDHAEMVAHHYVSALALARAAGQDVGPIVTRARVALREAGERALALNALAQAERYFAEALALAGDDDPERADLLFRYGRVLYLRNEEGANELAEARDGLLEAGDREAAAEAALMLADISWKSGRRDDMLIHLEAARSLVVDRPASRAQVAVLCHLARYAMLADRLDDAITLGNEGLAMAEELGFDDLRAHALNSIGAARASAGDAAGFADLEASIALASRIPSVSDLLRGHNNLASLHFLHGDLKKARAYEVSTLELAQNFGQRGSARFIELGAAIAHRYLAGEWDETLERADAVLAEAERGAPHYQTIATYVYRGLIRLARSASDGAESDAEHGIEMVRGIRDPQALPTLAAAAAIFRSTGNQTRAEETLDEQLTEMRELRPLGFAVVELHFLVWVALTFGREAEIAGVIERESFQSPWLRAARAVGSRDFRAAAEIFGEMGVVAHEAFYRLRAAEQLVAEGRRVEADEQLARALAFYRSVRASRYIREGDALLAATA